MVTIYGVVAVTFMMTMYALERRGRRYVLAFVVGCVLSSVYGFLSGAWPFGIVELIWAGVAVRRYQATPPTTVTLDLQPGSKLYGECMQQGRASGSRFGMLGIGVAACVACCAGPILAFLGGLSVVGLANTPVLGGASVVIAIVAGIALSRSVADGRRVTTVQAIRCRSQHRLAGQRSRRM